MNKQYSFLNEFVMTSLGIAATALSGISLVNGILQSNANKKYMNDMHIALFKASTRPQALAVVDQYCSRLQALVNKQVTDKTDNRVQQAQNYIRINFEVPLKNIIQNRQDAYWHKNIMLYMQNKIKKLNRRANLKHALNATTTASGALSVGAMSGAIGNSSLISAYGTAMTAKFATQQVINQLKFFKTAAYTKRMVAELQYNFNRESCLKVVEKYCYQMTTAINKNISKTKKQIPFDVQQEMLIRFYTPLKDIITGPNPNWHVQMMDYVNSDRIQSSVQHVCTTALNFLLPKVIRSGLASNVKVPNSVGTTIHKMVSR